MHTALFVATRPPERSDWQAFLGFADQHVKISEHVLRISENVWLIDAKEATDALGTLVYLAYSRGVVYGILPFEREPEWLPVAFRPTSMPDPYRWR